MKPKVCRAPLCKNVFTPDRTFQPTCSIPCAISYHHAKEEKKKAKAFKKETAERKEALKTPRDLIKEVQPLFNRYIRLRDQGLGLPCISCNRPASEIEPEQGWKPGGAWDCGHFLTVASHPELRFNELAAHRQCKSCNAGSSKYGGKGRTVSESYRENLIGRIGLPLVEWLGGPHKPLKPTVDELRQLRKYYSERVLEAKKYYGVE